MKTRSIFKSTIFIAICVCLGMATQAQFSIAPRISVGAALGKFSSTGFNVDNKVGIAIGVGSEVRYRFMDALSVHSGVFYQYLAHSIEGKGDDAGDKIKVNFSYINIPIELVYGKVTGFYGGAGLNIGIGVGGKEKLSNSAFPEKNHDESVKFDGKKNSELGADENRAHFKNPNLGLSLKAGYCINKLCFGVNANIGLAELSPNHATSEGGESYKLSSVSAHVAYVIGGASKKSK